MKSMRILGFSILMLTIPQFIIGTNEQEADQETNLIDQEAKIKKQTVILRSIMNGTITSAGDNFLNFKDDNQVVTETVDYAAKLVFSLDSEIETILKTSTIKNTLENAQTVDEFKKIMQHITPQDALYLAAQEFYSFMESVSRNGGYQIPRNIQKNRENLIIALMEKDPSAIIAATKKPVLIDVNDPDNIVHKIQNDLMEEANSYMEKANSYDETAKKLTADSRAIRSVYTFLGEKNAKELFQKCHILNNGLACRELELTMQSDPEVNKAESSPIVNDIIKRTLSDRTNRS